MTSANERSWIFQHAGTLAVVAVALGAIAAVLWLGAPSREAETATAGKWTCSMHPHVELDGPGLCPICNMPLIPASQLGSQQEQLEERAGIATAPAVHRELFKEIRAAGKLDYNERRVAYLTSRIAGRVDRVYADVAGTQVKADDHLVDIYSPQLVVAQAELIGSLDASERRPGDRLAASALESAREKLRLLGILPRQIEEIERSRAPTSHLTIYAPIGGVIIEKNVREQQYVEEGTMLYRIAELDPIWLFLDIYEADLAWVRYGQPVDVSVEAYPGEIFHGTIVLVDPFLNDATRTLKVRVNLANPDQKLKPAMYASATIRARLNVHGGPEPTGFEGKYVCTMHPEIVQDEPGPCPICGMPLVGLPKLADATAGVTAEHPPSMDQSAGVLAIPKSAVLETGRRRVAFRKNKEGAYELVELKLGPLAAGKDQHGNTASYYPVFAGLNHGDEVVVQGGFLLDSQRQIEGMPSLLNADMPAGEAAPVMSGEHKH